ncbi:unnamed protein product [marine sediment metagenome]|uniref:Uncharacterized protein n=1 Tax=marine sediment metagenome TaxID=412755 RepID=X1GSQ1_9ZZZZ
MNEMMNNVKEKKAVLLTIVAIVIGSVIGYGVSFMTLNPRILDLQTEIDELKMPKTWHLVTTINGNTTSKTELFPIQGSRWRLTWNSTPCQVMGVAIYSESNELLSLDNFWMEWFRKVPTQKGVIDVPEGNGNFYIKVFVSPMKPTDWTLKIEAWH